ncbi:MAG: hypothetical protein ACT4PP_16155 [Sporichthyaceae bacterium]
MSMFSTIGKARPRAARPREDGYALLSVIGFGTAMVLTVGAVGGYAIQTMGSAGRTQGSSAAVQAAQAGVDDFVARQMADPTYVNSPDTAWRAVPGSVDGNGTPCLDLAGSLPPNCPEFRHTATVADGLVTVTSTGRSRGLTRAVQVVLKARAFTDYLYFSEVEAADPADGFAYPPLLGAAPPGCGNPAWGPSQRPSSGCVIPTWRGGDATDGSRVHTDDVFEVVGDPSFDSRVTAAIEGCASDATACVRKTYDGGADPDYNSGPPAYADDLDLPANGLAAIAAAAAAAGCTYYGPTRIHYEGTAKMRVWSPQTPYTAACGGGTSAAFLATGVDVVVTALNRTGICSLLGGVTLLVCNLLGLFPVGSTVPSTLSTALSNNLLSGNALLQTLAAVVAPGDLVDVPANGAIYVRDNAPGAPIPDPTLVSCLVGSVAGMYSTLDTNVSAGLLNPNGTVGSNCTKGRLFVDGALDGTATVGVAGDIVITSNLTYRSDDNADNDRLGLIATGPIEVYNPLQCTLALGTCLSLTPLATSLTTALTALATSGTGNLRDVLALVPGYGQNIRVDAAILALNSRFGVQLPVLSVAMNTALLNQLVNLGIAAPTLTVNGSVAQRYRGIIGADLLNLNLGVPSLSLTAADLDIGYRFRMIYDGALRTSPPPFLPMPATVIWDPQSFAEIDVP